MAEGEMKGFNNPYRRDTKMTSTPDGVKHRAFEAGKDECLRCLKEEGLVVGHDNWGVDIDTVALREKINSKGTIVFIPDSEASQSISDRVKG